MSNNSGWVVGPGAKMSLSDFPVVDLAESSNTTRTLVVVLDSLTTAWCGRLVPFSLGAWVVNLRHMT